MHLQIVWQRKNKNTLKNQNKKKQKYLLGLRLQKDRSFICEFKKNTNQIINLKPEH